jgi:hypothetical protein
MAHLADDGGLSAILGVVTIRLEEGQLKALLIEGIDASPEPETIKSKIKEQIRAMPGEALKTAIMEIVKDSMARAPEAAVMFLMAKPLLLRILARAGKRWHKQTALADVIVMSCIALLVPSSVSFAQAQFVVVPATITQ